jgi:hypothetical protein
LLVPSGFPSELSCVAVAVYVPFESVLSLPALKAPPLGAAVALVTSRLAELKMWTTTEVVSLALPVKVGLVLLDGDFGGVRVTVGGAVLTVNVIGLLSPAGFPAELGWTATAVYWPLAKAGLAGAELQAPVPVAAAFETGTPSALFPA